VTSSDGTALAYDRTGTWCGRVTAGEGRAFGRAAQPWQVATVIAFLASDYASYPTGEVISVSSQHP
jgi:NAD(P)-dependent dehydrogenase (short-subunit alcohol dehydrogenase family)